jgi:hypothetical protein
MPSINGLSAIRKSMRMNIRDGDDKLGPDTETARRPGELIDNNWSGLFAEVTHDS